MTIAKCPRCDHEVLNVHYEAHDPNTFSGYRGSKSFTAVAYPCGHALSAVPVTWEMRLDEIERLSREINKKLDYLYEKISKLSDISKK